MRSSEAQCGVPQHMERCLQGDLEPSCPERKPPQRPLLTILGGASTRMTNRTSQEFSPQFCGRSRRLMHTCRLCRYLEMQLAGEGTQHTVATLGGGTPPRVPNFNPPVTSARDKKTIKWVRSAHILSPRLGGPASAGTWAPGSNRTQAGWMWWPGNSHDAEPRLLVLHPRDCGSDSLDGIRQQVD